MAITIPSKDYYSNMYDIENLTYLSDRKPSTNPVIKELELLIRNNTCTEALERINTNLSNDFVELIVLKGALEVKNIISKSFNFGLDLSPKTVALKELSEYLKMPVSKIEQKMIVEKPVEDDWKRINPDVNSEESVNKFYMDTDSYIYELMAANYIVQTLYSYKILSEKIKSLNISTIIDYGGGAGTLSIFFKELGYNVIYADLPGKTYNYAKWRFKQRDLDIPMVDLSARDISGIDADVILCTEVFEHVVDPVKLVRLFVDNLFKGNYLIMSESAEYVDNFSSHLESNRKYGGENFIKLLREYKFLKIMGDPFIPQQIFEKK